MVFGAGQPPGQPAPHSSYIDSEGELGELLVRDGRFAGFAPVLMVYPAVAAQLRQARECALKSVTLDDFTTGAAGPERA